MKEQEVRHVEKHCEIGKHKYSHWYRNMNKLTKTNTQSGLGQRRELHTQCEQREKEHYHDKKWKYRKKNESDQSDKEK
eukprot:14111894-Heterocapsa_arctica.AAC.1